MMDLYSRWKDEVLSTIAGCEQAMRVIKEPLAGSTFVGPYYFIMNDWQIRPLDTPHELVVAGTVVQDETSTLQSFKVDDLTSVVSIVRQVAVEVQVVETGTSGLTASESAQLANLDVAVSTRATPADVQIAGTPTIYSATTFTRTDGDNDGGGLAEIQSQDEQFAITGETATGLEVLVTVGTSTVGENPTLVRVVGYYASTQASHEVAIQLWNFNLSQWESKGVMTDRSTAFEYVVPMHPDNQDGVTGEMRMRFLHNTVSYKTQHALHIDYIGFEKVQTNSSMASDIATILNNQQQLLNRDKITEDFAVSATSNTITLATSASFDDDVYVQTVIKIVSGTGAGHARVVTGYVGATKVATLDHDWNVIPDSSSFYVVETFAGTSTQTSVDALNDFNPATDPVANVTLVDTTTTNTDMRGTDGANTVAPDNTGISDIKAKTDNLPDNPASKEDVFGASVL